MRLDQLSVTLRPRTPWEAMDLGFALVRAHAAAIWKPYATLDATKKDSVWIFRTKPAGSPLCVGC